MNHLSRWSGLDCAKFLCILLMVFIHAIFWLITDQDEVMNTSSFLYPIIKQTTFLGLFPLSLPITAGCGLRFYLEKIRQQTNWESFRLWPLVRISVALMILGYTMTLVAWGTEHAFEWDVLHFVGLSYLLIALALKVTTIPVFLILGFLIPLFSDVMRDLLGADTGWLGAILVGDDSGDFFWPLFPWFSTIVFGFGLAHFYLSFGRSSRFATVLAMIAVIGMGVSIQRGEFLLTLDPTSVWGPAVFQPSEGFIFGLIGFFSALLLLCNFVTRLWPLSPTGVVRSFSRGILWIYLLHIMIGVPLAHAYLKLLPLNLITSLSFAAAMIVLSWAIGRVSLLITEKQLRITLIKVKN